MKRGVELFYFHTDGEGNTLALTDGAGRVREQYDYGDYGQPQFFTPNGTLLPASAVGNTWLFRGLFYDPESELYHRAGNYFEPRIARPINRPSVSDVP